MDELISALGPVVGDISTVSAVLWERGWAERNAGNLSADVTGQIAPNAGFFVGGESIRLEGAYPLLAGRSFLVTGTGRRFRDCAQDVSGNMCLLRIGEDGKSFRVHAGGGGLPGFQPTSEVPSHLRIHEFLQESGDCERVVLHTHPTEMIALSHLPDFQEEDAFNHALWSMHPEVKVFVPRGVGLVPYTLPGSERLAQATVQAFRRGHSVAFWQMHGCVAIGADVMEAFDLIDSLNKAAKMLLLCLAAGRQPRGLSQADLDELEAVWVGKV